MSKTNEFVEKVDVCVIGAGHAGCEAALACARLGLETVIFTVSVDSIALMPCNPNVGGSSKGHLVRELDALGGEMGKNIDRTFIQSKMLNVSKGPAVHSLRAQADKAEYTRAMRKVLENQDHLVIKQAEVCELLWEETADSEEKPDGYQKRIKGVKIFTGMVYECKAVVLCTGTYLGARCLCGESITYTGPNGLQAANHLTESLKKMGIELRRFKTGTPARMDRRSLDFTRMEEQFGDERIVPFSFSTDPDTVQKEQVSCWLTYTNEKTHEIIRENLDRSPIYAGIIEGTGPRYCPSIEDKVVKFAEKERHQVFIEPEGLHTNEMYVAGMSSSLPEDVQLAMYRTVPGLENCRIVRNAYAIEYDCIHAGQLYPTLEFRKIRGLFSAGQFNGSSGYEEAACQGLVAGINAAMSILGKSPLTIDRSEGYIGVLIDDLVTKNNREPYRMMTSRAEYRLLLRQDNADLRLRKKGYEAGLISEEEYQHLLKKERLIESEIERLKNTSVGANKEVQHFLESHDSSSLKTAASLAELLCRPELSYEILGEIDRDRKALPAEVIEQVDIEIKYEGYIVRQKRQVEQYRKMEKKKIPGNLDYDEVPSLRIEARQNLKLFRPISIGQASRISGVSPADISVLLVYLERYGR
ncbi:tRNA uridine-5-carboxymethylaminomethyl(34) synthesis enzyme MnmG [Acetatifactor muris]|uniref:tRNA uridine 5-carboxymethylaminomethyl modification enzyme MnmG n=1 Tax=Acetatifactor muris TaxID=879566 RepID=A0A2K4ZLP7_9FIRM|nr:tRNA uridine-5-carboxymethylaminomethyl(34) synthesis enzyme MnmG [Acetatifactor muris]MCR2049642.1 tRNA uridine-5-carboxymethylaminomethyl(34) synthesis enzyme MnmG [Acetatifactor muris]SOY31409.1 tRNA uridine 5-carboxymethylaminomethyl modification enzyme MnmG [Acetatifactor muris]